jgi:glutamate dehydrogenase/leucine dehydrogenase
MDTPIEQKESQLVVTVRHGSALLGYVVIDSAVNGTSCGGLRIMPDIDEDEIRMLARSMSLKFGFLGLPQGGAKAGVIGDPEASASQKRARLLEFGRAIRSLLQQRLYIPAADMGTDTSDIRYMMEENGISIRRRELQDVDIGFYTALSVMISADLAAAHIGRRIQGAQVAVEGFGKVGRPLAGLLQDAGAKVVAVSTFRGALYNREGLDIPRMQQLSTRFGSAFVTRTPDAEQMDVSELKKLPVDILCPCARHHSIREQDTESITARIISPGANNPLTPEAEIRLAARGVVCIPDFAANCGGVLGGTMEFAAIEKQRIMAFFHEAFAHRMNGILKSAAKQGCTPREIAETWALRKIKQIQHQSEHPSFPELLSRGVLQIYRRGLIPGRWTAPLAISYFRRLMS